MGSLRFVLDHWRFLAFGFLLCFLASFGQTFYIAVFGGEIRAAFGLSHGEFGFAYGAGTLAAGLVFMTAGKAADRVDLRLFTLAVLAGLAVACLGLALAGGFLSLILAFALLRLFGQGLMAHTAATAMGRYFGAGQRGRAIGVSVLGFPAGEALFPGLAVLLIAAIGWRETWYLGAAALALLCPPLLLWLLRGHGARHAALLARLGTGAGGDDDQRQWSRGEVLADRRFHLAMLAITGPGFITTGIFFHQVHVAASKGWTLAWFATGFVAFALVKIAASLAAAVLVDRFGARRLTSVYLLPLALGLLVLAGFDAPASALVFMALAGMNGGMGQTVMGTLWAEIYGVRHLGAVRGLAFGVMVIAVSLAPALMGWLFDAGVTVGALALCCAAWCALGAALLARLFPWNAR